ncbi:DUF2690 domain-containing protein [Kitasatospora sp. NPDC050463]|uniref:DUF2690 domain-containing protein n=1 Tax=Kitasatospora sp. NPDC050463 TaxID=3155786 RepID=UPI003404F74D
MMRAPGAAALTLAAAAVLAPATALPTPAAAAAGCHGNACEGKNPKTLGCAEDARDIPRTEIRPDTQLHPRVWLRYSAKCHAVWAKGEWADGWTIRVAILDGDPYDAPTLASGEAFTAMVGADRTHHVGILDVDGQWVYGKWRSGAA